MTGWWQRARIVSVVGTGALMLGGGSAVYAIGTDDSVTLPAEAADAADAADATDAAEAAESAEAADADGLNFWSRWVRADDVIRFRVWLEGSGTEARLAVATTPAEALKGIECPQTTVAQVPVRGASQMCSLGEVDTRQFVDVLLTMPPKVDGVELTAVARMRNREGVWVTHTARTMVGNPASEVAEIMKAAKAIEVADPVLPRPAPGVPPRAPGAATEAPTPKGAAAEGAGAFENAGTLGEAETAQGTEVPAGTEVREGAEVREGTEVREGAEVREGVAGAGEAAPAAVPGGSGRPSVPPASAAPSNEPADPQSVPQGRPRPVAPLNPPALEAPQVPREQGTRAVPPDPHLKGRRDKGVPMILEEPSTPQESASVYEDPQTEQEQPRSSAGSRTGRAKADARSASSRALELAEGGQLPHLTGQAPQLPAGMQQVPQQALQAPGQVPQAWNNPNIQMPEVAPVPIASPLSSVMADSQPLGAPLPRDLDGSDQEITPIAESSPLLTGMRGLPVVGVAVGGLLGLLWLQMRVQRRRETRSVL
ncbi:hypothetical protein ACQPYK_42990 [Streptosporangium sp. CA-135522]|uniref:hypothetical protein n=1 Tax=Streptosporangium sp. CA-135522 TaxID=3240072 RepID=UPI003D8D4377